MALAETEILPIRMADGSRSKLTVFPGSSHHPVFIIMPAMGVRASYYAPLAGSLLQQGLQAVTADLRGHGYSSLRSSRSVDFGFHEMINQDLPAVVAATQGRFPRSPIYLLGHSLGGQMSVLYASLFPDQVAGVVLVSSGSVYFRGWRFPTSLAILSATQLAWGISRLLGYFPGHRLGFGGREARTTIRDWAHNARTGSYRPAHGERDVEAAMAGMTTPVLAISIGGDKLAPPRATRQLCGKLKSAPVRYLCMGSDEMPAAGLDHFAWVNHAAPIVEKIRPWMATNTYRLRN